jgi:hypothetical protein
VNILLLPDPEVRALTAKRRTYITSLFEKLTKCLSLPAHHEFVPWGTLRAQLIAKGLPFIDDELAGFEQSYAKFLDVIAAHHPGSWNGQVYKLPCKLLFSVQLTIN